VWCGVVWCGVVWRREMGWKSIFFLFFYFFIFLFFYFFIFLREVWCGVMYSIP
jgi:hypothetical protein